MSVLEMEHVLVLSDDIGATRDFETVCTRLERAGVPAVRNTVPGAGLHQLFIEDPTECGWKSTFDPRE